MDNVFVQDVVLHPDCALFNADGLVQVASKAKSTVTGEWRIPNRNSEPGNVLFDDIENVKEIDNGYLLTYNTGEVRFLESTDEGVDYRLWFGKRPEDAYKVIMLVNGSKERDLFSVELQAELEYVNDDTVIIWNKSKFNGDSWEDIDPNMNLGFASFQWYFYGVEGGDMVQGDFIANDGKLDLNKGNGDKRFCIITRDPNFPILSKDELEVTENGPNGAHYYLDYELEYNDRDREMLTLMAYTRTKDRHIPDMELVTMHADLWFTLDELFPNN